MAHDVFISYSRRDKPTADALCATLERNQIRCWTAPRDVQPGQDYAEALIEAIYESRIMVLVLSSSSNNSPQVIREVERAVAKGIPIIPFRIEDVPLSRSMEYFLAKTHWLDALTPPLEKHLERLAETVSLLLSRERPAEAPPEEEPYRPTLVRNAYETAKRWSSRPIVRLGAVLGAIGGAVVVVAIIVLIGLSSDGGGGVVFPLTPDEVTPAVSPTPVLTPSPVVETPTATLTPVIPPTPGPQLELDDAPYYLDTSAVLPGFRQLDPSAEGVSNADLGLGPDASEVVVYLSEQPLQLTFMFMAVASGEIEKASARAELRDEEYLEEMILAGFYEAVGVEEAELTVQWSDPAVGDAAKLARFTANVYGVESEFEMVMFFQDEGREAALVFVFNQWLPPAESPRVDTLTIAQEISTRIANR